MRMIRRRHGSERRGRRAGGLGKSLTTWRERRARRGREQAALFRRAGRSVQRRPVARRKLPRGDQAGARSRGGWF
jgi:hypothetical protein